MIRRLLTPLLVVLAACSTPIGQPAPPTATPQQLHDRAAAFAQPTQDGRLAVLKAQLDAAGLAWKIEEFDGKRAAPARGYNVVVSTGPSTGREILLTAHYDAVVLPDGKLADAIVDNAASVVAMIEATKRIAGRTKHPVRLLLTDQEELGLVGARAWIAAHGVSNLAAVINADVNGNGDTLMYGLNSGDQSKFLVTAVSDLCTARAMSCLDFPKYPPSDDVVFAAAGAPVISLGHQPKAEADKLRHFLISPQGYDPAAPPPEILGLIHTSKDNATRAEPATLAQAADFIVALVMKLDAELAR